MRNVDGIRLAEHIHDWAWNRMDGHKIWTGLWSAELVDALEERLGLGRMSLDKVEGLRAIALSIGRILADATLELWETKIREGKRTEEGMKKYTRKLAAAALLSRAKSKKKNDEAKRAGHEKVAANHKLLKQGTTNESVKMAFRLATWFGKLPANCTLAEYTAQYVNTPHVYGIAGDGNDNTVLSSSLVRGRQSWDPWRIAWGPLARLAP